LTSLAIDAILADLHVALSGHNRLVLTAPPGAGKSTRLPLALLDYADADGGRILILEPRRLAARNIAAYLARCLDEPLGRRIGLRMRGESRTSAATRIEIVTEGVLLRMLQQDPELSDYRLVIFDEYHERHLNTELALALLLQIQEGLRDDLQLLVMSATLEGLALPRLLPGAAYLEAAGRQFPLTVRHQPFSSNIPLEQKVGRLVLTALAEQPGSVLVFLPGKREIEAQQAWLLAAGLPAGVELYPLHGQLPLEQQQRAIAPAAEGRRKVVLSTNVAESSLTIEGILAVVDSGLERRAEFVAASGLTRLVTRPISQAQAQQRAGRAGRLGPGRVYRCWSEEQHGRLAQQAQAELLRTDLSDAWLLLCDWGIQSWEELALPEQPPRAHQQHAVRLLRLLQLVNNQGRITSLGRQALSLSGNIRVGSLLLQARALEQQGLAGIGSLAAWLGVWLEQERSGSGILDAPLRAWIRQREAAAATRVGEWLRRLKLPVFQALPWQWLDLLVCCAFPERIGRLRAGQSVRYQMSGGFGGCLHADHPLTGQPWLAGSAIGMISEGRADAQIFQAQPVSLASLKRYCPGMFNERVQVGWDDAADRFSAQRQQCLGELVLSQSPLAEVSPAQRIEAVLERVRRKGLQLLPWNNARQQLLERLRCAHDWFPEWQLPGFDEADLLARLEQWLAPFVTDVSRGSELARIDLDEALLQPLDWTLRQRLDAQLPTHFQVPTGSRIRLRYRGGQVPVLAVRLQEMFGQRETPRVAGGRVALQLELLSPAGRPLQITQDLVAFWQGSYTDVKKEMRGRYPKHVWPDDPAQATPTRKTKRQLQQE